MLRTRILTALVLVGLLIPAVFLLDDLGWGLLTAMIAGVGGWEFGRLARFCPSGQWRFGALIFAVTLGLAIGFPVNVLHTLAIPMLSISVFFWIAVVPFWLRSRRQIENHLTLALVGLILLVPTWCALVVIRHYGAVWLVGAILIVALADISAYFFGRAFGKRKLAPNISPGKTWEGAWGAMATVTITCVALVGYAGQLNASVVLGLIVGMPILTLISIAGDLLESMLKRQAGLKDSSNLLPGHGGVMDRIDSHTAALPLIALVLLLQNGSA